jgi:hypothetical protein
MSQYGGNWSHILTCAHVVCPWQYPNFYPPTGHTRYVSHITLPDTQIQVRASSLQGNIVYRHFVSQHSVFVHTNPRLDLCVVHPEQLLKRSGEMKMLWMQNEGYVMRPRLEVNEELQVGDYVWIYGLTAHENLFDEEKAPEPLMVPTGIRARVHTKTREHFFLDTLNVEGADKGQVHMGMCGSVIMRNGRCVGMLTATVHEESNCKELAGTAMCTYASDIFEFLLEVEKQLKTMPISPEAEKTQFQSNREAEGVNLDHHKDWKLDLTRVARHVPCPRSLWRTEEKWVTEEDLMSSQVFGKGGVFDQEVQENVLGHDMNSSKADGSTPAGAVPFSTAHTGGRVHAQGERRDSSPRNIYSAPEAAKEGQETDHLDFRDLFNSQTEGVDDISMMNGFRQNIENTRIEKERKKMKENVFKHAASRSSNGFTDPLNSGSAGHYGGNADHGSANFSAETMVEDHEWRAAAQKQAEAEAAAETPTDTSATTFGSSKGFEKRYESAPPSSPSANSKNTTKEERARIKREKEAEYQKALRARHNQFQPQSDGNFERH